MPKPNSKTGTALPSKADILAFMAGEAAAAIAEGKGSIVKSRKREVARAFNIKGSDRVELKRMLRELEDEGQIARRRAARRSGEAMPTMVVADITTRDRDGDLLASPIDWDAETHGPAPRILVETPSGSRPGRPVPGVGERALLRIAPDPEAGPDGPSFTGRVVKMIARDRARLLGIVRRDGDHGFRVQSVDKKNASEAYVLPEEARNGAEEGELVAIEPMGRQRILGLQVVRVAERLGSLKGEKAVSTIAILTHGIPHVFRPETLAEAEAVRAPGLDGREDWRALPLVTIDPPDAKDHDDAVHAAPDTAADNPGGMVVTVAIADVASLVAPRSAMDREAVDRGNSVYFPDRVVPMLPERVSTDLGSLRPHEDRPALAVRLVLDAEGHKKRHSFHRVMMRSAAKTQLRSGPGGHGRCAGRDDAARCCSRCWSRSGPPTASPPGRATSARRSTSTCPSASSSSSPTARWTAWWCRNGSMRTG